jgi:hypothetical protein
MVFLQTSAMLPCQPVSLKIKVLNKLNNIVERGVKHHKPRPKINFIKSWTE